MKAYKDWSKEELLKEKESLEQAYQKYKTMDFTYNMARGRPCTEQLNLSNAMLDAVSSKTDALAEDGLDCRNYGVLDGLPETKKMLADIMDTTPEHVIVFGNSSLNAMYDVIAKNIISGVCGYTPQGRQENKKWLCPVPGYDRHFGITEYFGYDMINIPLSEDGPDMDMVEDLVNNDPTVKGIWCVPKYSNPQGLTYSDETVRRFARLKPAAEDFRIFWDNAYCVHDLYPDRHDELLDLISEAESVGNEDIVYEFCSTSKISFPGAGIAGIAASERNRKDIKDAMMHQTIGSDKINQLRHARFFKNLDFIKQHMQKHADIIRPKFELFMNRFNEEHLRELGAGDWIEPHGGYFIGFEAMEGCATAIVNMAREAGVVMTEAGAPFPYHKDPKDSVIRIAPTLPPMDEIRVCVEVFIICAKLATVNKVLESR